MQNANLFLPDGVKASTCFHSGYYLTQTFYPMVVSSPNSTTFNTYSQNYCDSYSEQLAERYLFVQELMPVHNQTQFEASCQSLVSGNPNLNAWFDPLAILPTITVEDICADQWSSFEKVYNSTATDTSVWTNDFVESSYLASLTLNIEGQMHDDYANCINKDVLDDPSQWATSFLDGHPTFLITTEQSRMSVAAQAAD